MEAVSCVILLARELRLRHEEDDAPPTIEALAELLGDILEDQGHDPGRTAAVVRVVQLRPVVLAGLPHQDEILVRLVAAC
jgi:hypothetical protein